MVRQEPAGHVSGPVSRPLFEAEGRGCRAVASVLRLALVCGDTKCLCYTSSRVCVELPG